MTLEDTMKSTCEIHGLNPRPRFCAECARNFLAWDEVDELDNGRVVRTEVRDLRLGIIHVLFRVEGHLHRPPISSSPWAADREVCHVR